MPPPPPEKNYGSAHAFCIFTYFVKLNIVINYHKALRILLDWITPDMECGGLIMVHIYIVNLFIRYRYWFTCKVISRVYWAHLRLRAIIII